MNTDDFEEPETFECESPLHVSKREVHISEGGCDEIEIGLGMALCSECWCKYADLIEAAPVPNEAVVMTDAAINLEALAETLERAASELRLAAKEKRKNTPAQPVIVHKPTELDQARAKRKLRDLGIDT